MMEFLNGKRESVKILIPDGIPVMNVYSLDSGMWQGSLSYQSRGAVHETSPAIW